MIKCFCKAHPRIGLAGLLLMAILLSDTLGLAVIKPVQASPYLYLKWITDTGAGNATARVGTFISAQAAKLRSDLKGLQIVVTGVPKADLGWMNGTVAALDGVTGKVLWQVSPGGIGDHQPFEIADLRNDGSQEIVLSNWRRTVALNGNDGSTYWINSGAPSYDCLPVIFDINGTGNPEVFVCSGYGPDQGVDYITSLTYDGFILQQQNTSWHPCWGGLAIGDPSFDGNFKLLQADRSIDYNNPGEYQGGGRGVKCIDPYTLKTIWNDSFISCSSHTPIFADVDKDGVLDVVVGMQNGVNGIAVLNASDGSVLTTNGKYREGSVGIQSHSQPTVCDIDNNKNLEMISNEGSNPKIWDLYNWSYVGQLPVVCGDPPEVANVTGSDRMDIIAVTGDQIYIYDAYRNSTTGLDDFVLKDHVTGLYGGCNDATLVADVDGDGYNELVVTSANGRVYCFGTGVPASTPAPRSQTAYYSEYRRGVAEYVAPPGPLAPKIFNPSPSDGAVNVSQTLSQVSFNLTDYQKNLMNYTVTTTPPIGSSNGTNVSNGIYLASISNLQPSTLYTWTVNATDGQNLRSINFRFTTSSSSPQQSWWDYNWVKRKEITIDHTKISSSLSNFPVLIDITGSDLASQAQSNGNDIVFTDSSNQKLNHQIESFNSTSGHLVAWVTVPNLSTTQDTNIFMYYGNPNATNQQNGTGVWDSNYLMVQHLSEKSGMHLDSTLKHNDGTPYGNVTQGVVGKIDGCDAFYGGYVNLTRVCSAEAQFTFSAWIYPLPGARYFISEWWNSQGAFLQVAGDSGVQMYVGGTYVEQLITLNQWHYVVGTYDGVTARLYVDGGTPSSVTVSGLTWASQNMYVGDRSDNQRHFNGFIDEVRVSNINRNASWIRTEYSNQQNPSAFYTVGPEETFLVPQAPVISNPVPLDGAAGIKLNPTLSVTVNDYQGYSVTVLFRTNSSGVWKDLGSYNGGNNVYNQNTTGMDNYSTTYWWSVNASDVIHWTSQTYHFTTKPKPANWWNSGWQYRKTITIDHTKVSSNQTNFPVVIDLTDSTLPSKTQPNGNDFVFTDSSNSRINHEIESYDNSTGHLIAWVNVPSLSSVNDTTLYLYYGNSSCGNQQNKSAVWNANYLMVLHLNEISGTSNCSDSTIHGNNGTINGSVTQGVVGKVDGACSFYGGYIDLPHVCSVETQFTFSAWIYPLPGARYFISEWWGDKGAFLQIAGDNELQMYVNDLHVGQSITLNQWHYVVGTYNGSSVRLCVDGGAPSSMAASNPTWPSQQDMFLGDRSDHTRQFSGFIDEVRVSNIAMSDSWIGTEYKNQQNPSAFYTFGSEESF